MKDTKKHGVFWFFKTLLTFALVIYTCVRCCMIVSDKHHAAAFDGGPSSQPNSTHTGLENGVSYVPLTPAQTVALYGTQLTALLRDVYSDDTQAITFNYAFPLSSIGYMDGGSGFSADNYYDNTYYLEDQPSLTSSEVRHLWADRSGIVYVADASQWGDTPISGFGSSSGRSFQLHVPFSVTFHNITRFRTNFFYSCQPLRVTGPFNSNTTNIYKALTNIANADFYSVRGDTYAGINSAASMPLPTYPYYINQPVDDSRLGYFSGFIIDLYEDESYTEEFDLTGATVDAFLVKSVSASSNDLWLIVGCPTIYGYDPPDVTTTRPPETIPVATYPVETMPPAYTDTPQNILNQNLITNNYQLNLIIGQLNLIYNQLKLNGELNARLAAALDADNDPGLQFPENTNIRQYMSEVFYQTGTDFVYSPEDLQSYTKAIPWLSSMLHGQTWFIPFAFLGTIGLIMIVFSYLVFRR